MADNSELAADLAALSNITLEEAKAQLMQTADTDPNEMVLPVSMMPAIVVAVHSHDQLRTVAGMNGLAYIGFDNTAVEATARMHGVALTPSNSRDLAVVQAEGLKILRSAS